MLTARVYYTIVKKCDLPNGVFEFYNLMYIITFPLGLAMKYLNLHPWKVGNKKAVEIQKRLEKDIISMYGDKP